MSSPSNIGRLRRTQIIQLHSKDDIKDTPMLYDSAELCFNRTAFFKELFIHLTFPFFIWGQAPCHLFFEPNSILFVWIFPAAVFLMIASYYLTGASLQGGYAVPLCLYVLQRTTIALKYATLTKTEYERYTSVPKGPILAEYVEQVHLLFGWERANKALIEFEVGAAAARQCVKLDSLRYYLPRGDSCGITRWNTFLAKSGRCVREDRSGAETLYYVSCKDVCYALTMKSYLLSVDPLFIQLLKLLYLYNILLAAIPFWNKDLSFPDVWAYVYYASSTLANIGYGLTITFFLRSSLVSEIRQYLLTKDIFEMIRLSDEYLNVNIHWVFVNNDNEYTTAAGPLKASSLGKISPISTRPLSSDGSSSTVSDFDVSSGSKFSNSFNWLRDDVHLLNEVKSENVYGCENGKQLDYTQKVPNLSLHSPGNIYAWLFTRNLMQDFGARFRFRIDCYMGSMISMLLALMGMVILQLSINDPTEYIATVFAQQVLLSVVVMAIVAVTYVLIGALCNSAYVDHTSETMQVLIQCKKIISDLKVNGQKCGSYVQHLSVLADISEALQTSFDAISLANQVNPMKILGIVTTTELAFGVATGCVGFIALVWGMVTKSGL